MRTTRQALLRAGIGRKFIHLISLRQYFAEIGWFRSAAEGLPVAKDGECLPWFTYPAIFFLSGRIRPEMAVFEFGSGHSTLWFAKRLARVVSCEHDAAWYKKWKDRFPENVTYIHHALVEGGEYSKAILQYRQAFDIVLIDGEDRIHCAKNALNALNANGVIIWDNSDYEIHKEGYAFLTKNGFRRIDFAGLGPINFYGWQTSIFYRSDNCMGI